MGFAGPLLRALRPARPWRVAGTRGSWREAEFSVVDLEATGLDLARDEVVSAGAVRVAHGRVTSRTFYEVARPRGEVSPDAVRLHALTADELADAPPFEEVLRRLRAEIQGTVIVAHAAWVERSFLDRYLRQWGERLPDEVVDTAALARFLGLAPATDREPSLEALARRLGLPVHTPHHALGDAMTTAGLFLVMAGRLEQAHPGLSVADLLRISARHSR
jgi:DNA polymerase-3 subunit epsilon